MNRGVNEFRVETRFFGLGCMSHTDKRFLKHEINKRFCLVQLISNTNIMYDLR